MSWLAACLIAQALLTSAFSSSWWVPDLTLVGLVLAVARTPSRWFLLSVVAGVFTMAWAIRFPKQVFLFYVAL